MIKELLGRFDRAVALINEGRRDLEFISAALKNQSCVTVRRKPPTTTQGQNRASVLNLFGAGGRCQCKCGSFAINEGMHGRDNTDLEV